MAYSMMFIALGATTEAEVRDTFGQLRLGTLQKVDRAEITEGPKAGMVKFFLHYSVLTADTLRAELDDFETRKKEGEVNVRPKRVVYGVKKNGDGLPVPDPAPGTTEKHLRESIARALRLPARAAYSHSASVGRR
jgi:hypothetical protein